MEEEEGEERRGEKEEKKERQNGTTEMAQQLQVLANPSDDQSSIPRTHMIKELTPSLIQALWHTLRHLSSSPLHTSVSSLTFF